MISAETALPVVTVGRLAGQFAKPHSQLTGIGSAGWHCTSLRLVLADRNVPSFTLWREVAATGADLLWRMSASFTLPVLHVLHDDTYLSELRPPHKKDGPPISVRVTRVLRPDRKRGR